MTTMESQVEYIVTMVVTKMSELVTKMSDLVTKMSDLVTKMSELVTKNVLVTKYVTWYGMVFRHSSQMVYISYEWSKLAMQ